MNKLYMGVAALALCLGFTACSDDDDYPTLAQRNADKIIFMKDGDIKEVGSHDQLMELDGLYADMYRSMSSP